MRTVIRALAGLTLAATILVLAPCAHSYDLSKLLGSGEEHDNFALIHVADLRGMMASDANAVHIYDANGPETRDKFGVIPGAVLLTSDDAYDLSVLPPSKTSKLVFYCANTH
jgi:hypothetical protein